jgi:CubicO group peptidase (beta-lactamase class C family)
MNFSLPSVLLYITVVLTSGSVSQAQDIRQKQFENNLTEVRSFVFTDSLIPRHALTARMAHYHIPSVSVALIENGQIEWAKAYGWADVAAKRKANAETLYQVASISKSINALGIMALAEKGQLSLEEDVRNYLRTWKFPDNDFSKGKKITLTQLLSHTAGLGVHGFIGYPHHHPLPTVNQILDGQSPANNEAIVPIFTPGERAEYSGGGTTLIRKILDDQISKNYDSLMQALVLRPLKMKRSTFQQPLSVAVKNVAWAHDKAMKPVTDGYYVYPEQAAGGLWATASDIARMVLAVQKMLHHDKGGILSQNTVTNMLTPVQGEYAMGFGIQQKGNDTYFYHEGQGYGYTAVYYGSKTQKRGVVVLTNAYPDNGQAFVQEVLNAIATTYQWEGFYHPEEFSLAALPEAQLEKYVGTYESQDPPIKISITKKGAHLQLQARRPERMYALDASTFFLGSSPSDRVVFLPAPDTPGEITALEVRQGEQVLFRAVRQKQ